MNKDILLKFISKEGYRKNSPDKDNPINIIPSNSISMKGVDFDVLGVSNTGDKKVMQPGEEYIFDGDYVVEMPLKQFKIAGEVNIQDIKELFNTHYGTTFK